MTRASRLAALCAALLPASGCDAPATVTPAPAPSVDAALVDYDPLHVLMAVARVRVRDADSAALSYGRTGQGVEGLTPAVRLAGDTASVPLLGLHPESRYALELVAFGPGGIVRQMLPELTTGALPEDLPGYSAGGPAPSAGYVVFGAGMYGLVIDNTGRVVWYHRFPAGPGLNFQVQPNGRYYARPPITLPGALGPWVELDALGTITRTFGCAGGLQTRFHDLIAEPGGTFWLLCDETRTMDLRELGGRADAAVTGTGVQHLAASGLLFAWSPFDHFDLAELPPDQLSGAAINWTHANALDRDAAGNLLVSFRNLSEITKIQVPSGTILWRMGGHGNQFSFDGAEPPLFASQHGLRLVGSSLLLLDNLGDPAGSRAERYEIDEINRSVRLTGAFSAEPSVIALLGGTTQPLPGGRTLVAYGNGNRVEEYDASGNVVWRIHGNPGYVFRAQRIASLYRPGEGLSR